jgi:hypothetical protein
MEFLVIGCRSECPGAAYLSFCLNLTVAATTTAVAGSSRLFSGITCPSDFVDHFACTISSVDLSPRLKPHHLLGHKSLFSWSSLLP